MLAEAESLLDADVFVARERVAHIQGERGVTEGEGRMIDDEPGRDVAMGSVVALRNRRRIEIR